MKGVCVGRGWGRKEDEVGSGAVIVFLFFFFKSWEGKKEKEKYTELICNPKFYAGEEGRGREGVNGRRRKNTTKTTKNT